MNPIRDIKTAIKHENVPYTLDTKSYELFNCFGDKIANFLNNVDAAQIFLNAPDLLMRLIELLEAARSANLIMQEALENIRTIFNPVGSAEEASILYKLSNDAINQVLAVRCNSYEA